MRTPRTLGELRQDLVDAAVEWARSKREQLLEDNDVRARRRNAGKRIFRAVAAYLKEIGTEPLPSAHPSRPNSAAQRERRASKLTEEERAITAKLMPELYQDNLKTMLQAREQSVPTVPVKKARKLSKKQIEKMARKEDIPF